MTEPSQSLETGGTYELMQFQMKACEKNVNLFEVVKLFVNSITVAVGPREPGQQSPDRGVSAGGILQLRLRSQEPRRAGLETRTH